jgi:hypothetical protein
MTRFSVFTGRKTHFTGRISVASPANRTAGGADGLKVRGGRPYSRGRHRNLVSGRLGETAVEPNFEAEYLEKSTDKVDRCHIMNYSPLNSLSIELCLSLIGAFSDYLRILKKL